MAEYFVPADLCEDLLCCVICYEPFADDRIPKALPCLHTFCSACLQSTIHAHKRSHYRRKGSTTSLLPCPVCNEVCKIPANGPDGFKDDFRIRRMSVALTRTKTIIEKPVNTTDEKNEEDIQAISLDSRNCDVCKFFNKQSDAPLYCLECNKQLCESCSGKHLNTPVARHHNVVKSTDTMVGDTTCKKHISEALKYFCRTCSHLVCMACTMTDEHTEHEITTLEEESAHVKENLTKMMTECQEKISKILGEKSELDNLEKVLDEREKVARKAVLARTFEEMTRVKNNQMKIEKDLASICRSKYQELTNWRNKLDKEVSDINELSDTTKTMMDLGHNILVVGSHNEVSDKLRSFLTVSRPPPPEVSTFTNLGKYDALVEEQETSENPADTSLNQSSILAEIKSVVSQMRRFSEGRFDLRIDPIKTIGKKGSADGEFNFPAGVAVLNNGDIAVADMHNYRVQIFDANGNFKKKFGHEGFKPCGIAAMSDGNIAVTDCKSSVNCIKVFTPSGERIKQLGLGEFDYPFSLAVDSKGHFIVSDPAVSRITVLNPDGSVLSKFPTKSKFTFYLNVNSRDEIHVSDWYHHHIKVFNTSGKLLRKIGSRGQEDGQLMVPLGVVCDKKDNVIVLDCKCERVSMFSSEGTFISHLIGKSEGIQHSRAMALSSDGHLVITHGDNKRDLPNEIRVYRM